MFSTNPFTSSSFIDHEKDSLYFNHHWSNHPFVSGDCFLHAYSPPALENFQDSGEHHHHQQQQQLIRGSGYEYYDDYSNTFDSGDATMKNKKTSKKDHHSKIYTAQGPRDRRVRLSIEISRKFFCLQDLLGFDKASKTLDWLFTKSKTAIDELLEGTKHSSSSTVTDQSEVGFLENIKGGSDEEDEAKKKKTDEKRKKTTRKHKSVLFPVNQSRGEARARARERTKEKQHIKKIDDESKKVLDDCCPSNLILQSSFWSPIELQNDYSYQHSLDFSKDSSNFTSLPGSDPLENFE